MKAIILAGGLGTRLRPVIGDEMPKCLAPVMGRPMVDLIIRNLRKQDITDITLALHWKAEQFVEKFGATVKYKIESEPLGTGGAIKNCIEGDEPTLVLNGDTITNIDYTDILKNHTGTLTIAVTQKDGIMTSAGTYILNREIFDNFDGTFSFEQDVIPKTLKKFYTVEWFTDYGVPETYNNAPKDWV